MSTFNTIEMLDDNGESFVIQISRKFAKWNQEIVKASSFGAEWHWSSIAKVLKTL